METKVTQRVPYRRLADFRHNCHIGTAEKGFFGHCSCVRLAELIGRFPEVGRVDSLRPAEVRNLSPDLAGDVLVCPWCAWGYVLIPALAVA